jgi:hypothetical protein
MNKSHFNIKEALKSFRWKLAIPLSIFFTNKHIVKQAVIYRYAKLYHSTEFVETGTFLGEMVSALRNVFKQIYSIELETQLATRAQQHFHQFNHIKIIQGDSAHILPKLIKELNTQNPIFWLDGHYSGGITAKGDKTTPIEEELESIASAKNISKEIVLIDDARLFNGENEYPDIIKLKTIIKNLFPLHQVNSSKDIIRITPPTKPD